MGQRNRRFTLVIAVFFCFTLFILLGQISELASKNLCRTDNCVEGQPQHRNLLMTGDVEQAPDGNRTNLTKGKLSQCLPQLLIIGVRKGGTRALLDMLDLHPLISKVPVEVHFFDKSSNYQRGLEWYRTQMPWTSSDQLTVEKSPSYFVTPEVPERVWAMNPGTKLLLIVRDPVTRLLSDFTQIEASRINSGLPGRRFQDVAILPSGEVNIQNRALHVSLYAKFLSRWLNVFPRRQLHIVDGDRLIREPWSEIHQVEAFLNLEPRIRRDQFYFNATKGFYCLQDGSAHKCLPDSKGRRHPQVPTEVISQLRQFFAPHNKKFFAMVGRAFDWPER